MRLLYQFLYIIIVRQVKVQFAREVKFCGTHYNKTYFHWYSYAQPRSVVKATYKCTELGNLINCSLLAIDSSTLLQWAYPTKPKLHWETYNHRNQPPKTIKLPHMWNITNLLSGMCRVNNIWSWRWWMCTRHNYSFYNFSVKSVSPRLILFYFSISKTSKHAATRHLSKPYIAKITGPRPSQWWITPGPGMHEIQLTKQYELGATRVH
jgi:hypothetical protein